MRFRSEDERNQVLARLSLISLYILMALDAVMILVGYFLARNNTASVGNPMVRNIIFAVAVADMAATFILRNLMLKQVRKSEMDPQADGKDLYKKLLNISIVVAAMCSAISTYGLILVALGEKFEILILFVAVSLVGYQLFRLRPRDFEDNTPLE